VYQIISVHDRHFVITFQLKAKEKFLTARRLLLYYKNNRTKAEYFPKFITIYISKSSNGTSVSLVRASAILLFRVLGKLKLRRWGYPYMAYVSYQIASKSISCVKSLNSLHPLVHK